MNTNLETMLRRRPAPAAPGVLGLTPFAGPQFSGAEGFEIPPFPGSRPAAGPGADMAMRPDGAGAPLPVGAAVTDKGVPGLYESVRTAPALNAGLAGPAPAPSRFTLVQTNPIAARGPQAGTGAAFRGTATMQALAQIYGGGQPAGPENRSIAARGYTPPEGVTAAQQAAYLAEQNRLDLATNDEVRRLAPNLPQAGQTPEVRANNQRYLDKILREQGGADPQELARQYQQTMQASRDPRRVNLGVDAKGNPIERIVDANGNSSALPGQKEDPTEIERLQAARDRAQQAGRSDLVDELSAAIKNATVKYDAYGRPLGGAEQRDGFESEGLPSPPTRVELAKLPPGASYIGLDGAVYTKPKAAPAQASRPQAPGVQIDNGSADAAALKWARENPNDPRAAAIIRKARGAAK